MKMPEINNQQGVPRYAGVVGGTDNGRQKTRNHGYDVIALVICIIVCLSWAVNHYRDNAITYKAQRDKNARELKLANAAITDMQMRQRDVAALDAKYTKELADAKAENDALRDDVALVVVGCTSKQSVSQCVKPPPPPAWIMQPPRLAEYKCLK